MAEMSRLSHELHTDKHIVNIEHREMIDASESTGTHTHTHTHIASTLLIHTDSLNAFKS